MGAALERDISLQVDDSIIQGGWKKCCEEFFNYTKKKIGEQTRNNTQVAGEIVLTGGASKMGFIKELADKVYPVKKNYTVTCATNPSFSVSHGLVWIGLVDEYEYEIVSIVTKTVNESEAVNIYNLKDSIKSSMGETVYQLVLSSMDDWANSCIDESLNDLSDRMTHKINNAKNNTINHNNRRLINNWSDGITKEIRKQLEQEINKKLGPALGQKLEMSDSDWESVVKSLNNIKLDVDSIVNNIDVSSMLNKIFRAIIIFIYVCIFGMIFLPLAIVGWCIGEYLASELSDDDKYKARNKPTRNKAYEKMKTQDYKNNILSMCNEEIDNAIDAQLTKSSVDNYVGDMVRIAYEVMTLKPKR